MNGIIYCIECNDTGNKYVGATTRRLKDRIWSHKGEVNNYDKGKSTKKITSYDIIKNDNYKSYILEEGKVDSLRELNTWERRHIENIDCINKNIPYRINRSDKPPVNKVSKAERDKAYRNGEKRDEILQKKRDYHKEHAEEIKAKRSVKIDCECGGYYTLSNKAGHLKTNYHLKRINNK